MTVMLKAVPMPIPDSDRPAAPAYEATDLTQGGSTALIQHNGQVYVLRITRAGKLILTK